MAPEYTEEKLENMDKETIIQLFLSQQKVVFLMRRKRLPGKVRGAPAPMRSHVKNTEEKGNGSRI